MELGCPQVTLFFAFKSEETQSSGHMEYAYAKLVLSNSRNTLHVSTVWPLMGFAHVACRF